MNITEKDVGRKVITRGGEEGQITEYVKCTKFPVKVCLEQSGFYAAYAPDGAFLPFDSPHVKDLVGFVDEKQVGEELNYEPFNLERALAGEAVVTRDGREVSQVTLFECSSRCPLVAVVGGEIQCYTKQGRYLDDRQPSNFDLFMKPKTRIINGFEVPAPEAKEPDLGDIYFTPDIYCSKFYREFAWDKHVFEARFLERGLVFLRKEDAIANAKAMLGINPYGE